MSATPSAQYRLTIRVKIDDAQGMLGQVTDADRRAGRNGRRRRPRRGERRAQRARHRRRRRRSASTGTLILAAIATLAGAEVIDTIDRTFLLHVGGKIEQHNKHPLKTRDDLSMAYTPGVARVCTAIKDDPDKAFQYTIKRNTVAVVSDGTAVLGLGDIGPAAAMPVMEGKACLFKEFAGVDAFPICLDTKDTGRDRARLSKLIAPAFGGINLEDISAPRCFEIEERLKEELDIPVFHDDQHGTAVVVLAALLNAVKLTGRQPRGSERAGHRPRRRGRRRHQDPARRPACATSSAPTRAARCTSAQGLPRRNDELGQALVRGGDQPASGARARPAEVIEGADLLVGLSGARALPARSARAR